jgi:probable phosphomutase (TIGR03848 family)
MTSIYLIRHGENDFVGKGKLAGWLPGVRLNENGRKQADVVAELFEKVKLNAIYASPLERTMETAQPLADAQKLKITRAPGIGEIQFGTWQGKSLKALRKRKLWPVVQATPSLARFPEGESFTEAQARAVAEIESLRSRHRGKKDAIACVSHSDVIKLIVAHYLGLPLDLFQRLHIAPASITALWVDDSHSRLLYLNDMRASRAAKSE